MPAVIPSERRPPIVIPSERSESRNLHLLSGRRSLHRARLIGIYTLEQSSEEGTENRGDTGPRFRRTVPSANGNALTAEHFTGARCRDALCERGNWNLSHARVVDGFISGTTEFGALRLLRLSGAVKLETGRGDVILRQSYVKGSVHTDAGRVLLEDIGGDVQGTSSKGGVIERRVERSPRAP